MGWKQFPADVARHVGRWGKPAMGCIRAERNPKDLCLTKSGLLFKTDRPGALSIFTPGPRPSAAEVMAPSDVLYRDQGGVGRCTAFGWLYNFDAAHFQATGRHLKLSGRFLYWLTLWLAGRKGDVGATITEAVRAFLLGVPWEDEWPGGASINPRSDDYYDKTPTEAVKQLAELNRARGPYARLDHEGISGEDLLDAIKGCIVAKRAVTAGWLLYDWDDKTGEFALPKSPSQRPKGGHAMTIYGYDDAKGKFWLPNSWRLPTGWWGDGGRAWIPYEYVLRGCTPQYDHICWDFWMVSGFQWEEPIRATEN